MADPQHAPWCQAQYGSPCNCPLPMDTLQANLTAAEAREKALLEQVAAMHDAMAEHLRIRNMSDQPLCRWCEYLLPNHADDCPYEHGKEAAEDWRQSVERAAMESLLGELAMVREAIVEADKAWSWALASGVAFDNMEKYGSPFIKAMVKLVDVVSATAPTVSTFLEGVREDERKKVFGFIAGEFTEHIYGVPIPWLAERDERIRQAARDEQREVDAGLTRYVVHLFGCLYSETSTCSCGLLDILNELEVGSAPKDAEKES